MRKVTNYSKITGHFKLGGKLENGEDKTSKETALTKYQNESVLA